MLDYVYGHDKMVADFVAQLIPSCRARGFPAASKAIGVIDEQGNLIAGVVYHNWEPEAQIIEMSGATLPGKNWLTRNTLKRIFQYPFLQLRCQMIVQRVAAADERLLRIFAAYGYMLIRVPRMLGRDRDGVLALLTYEDWMNNRFNARWKHYLPDDIAEAAE